MIKGELVFLNTGNSSLENINIRHKGLEDFLSVDRNKIDLVPSGSQFSINVLINTSVVKFEKYRGEIFVVASNGVNYSLPVHVDIFKEKKNETTVKTVKNNINYTQPTVAEDGGSFGNSSVWILLITFILIVAGVIYYLYKKGKPKQQAYENLVESFRQRS